jgi:hypothetical protein
MMIARAKDDSEYIESLKTEWMVENAHLLEEKKHEDGFFY